MAPDRSASSAKPSLASLDIICPSLNRRYSGVTSTIIALLPVIARRHRIAGFGFRLPDDLPQVNLRDLLLHGWRPPEGRSARIWHARRNIEMIFGVVLRDVLRQPWRLVFTSAAQRRHTWLTRALLRRMDRVIATSEGAGSFLKVPHVVSQHGVDVQRFHPAEDRDAAWQETGLPGRYGIGIFGRVRPQKGTDLFVDALIDVLPSRPDWTAVVIGLETPEEATFGAGLRRRLQEAGLEARVRFLGERPVEEMPAWFRRLSIVVAPPRKEGFGLIPLEAMASATPVIASRAGAHAELVVDGVTGELVPAGDAAALTKALSRLMDLTPAERDGMGRAGREHVTAHFSIEREARRIEAVYAALLGEGTSGEPSAGEGSQAGA